MTAHSATGAPRRELPGGGSIPALGLGTWRMGESALRKARETAAIRSAIALGYRLFDTAEMYGEGGAETILGAALADALRAGEVRREDLFVVSKVYPHNASRKGTVAACKRSLARLGLERIDLYLLHWRGQHPLEETVEGMRELVGAGRIAHWGVSNFDVGDLQELATAERRVGRGESTCATDQVYYSLSARGPEFGLLPRLRERGVTAMAYSPIDQGALARNERLHGLAARRGASAAQLALAWLLHQPGIIAIPKAVKEEHLKENLAAQNFALSPEDLTELDRLFPPPRRKTPLDMR